MGQLEEHAWPSELAQAKVEGGLINGIRVFVPKLFKTMIGLGVTRNNSNSAESPSVVERLGALSIDVNQLVEDCKIIMSWDLEWAGENGELIYTSLRHLNKILPKLKKGAQRDCVKQALEHVTNLSLRATSRVTPPSSRSPS